MYNTFIPDYDQKQVIDIVNERAIVFAAPGCGKTEILSRRIIQAHEEYGVPYEKMLCLTFTNRASREMKDRIKENIQEPTAALFVGNIHRFCIRFLIDNDLIPLDASIIDDQDQIDILTELSGDILKPWRITDITHKCVALFQQEHNHPEDTILYNYGQIVDEDVNKYRRYKAENHILDFDDILLQAYDKLLHRKGDEDYKYVGYSWIQVDEIQDLNPLQLAIIRMVALPNATVVYLGDEQQSIYSFLGGGQRTLQSIRDFCGNKIYRLYSNHRSPKYIVELLNHYATNQLGVDPTILPNSYSEEEASDDSLTTICCDSDADQPCIIANEVRQLVMRNPNESTGILVRTNDMGQNISEILKEHHIKHLLISNKDIFKRVDFKTLFSHFAVVSDDTRSSEWTRLLYQTKILDKMLLARRFTKKLRQIALTPADLMKYDESSYVLEFSKMFHNEEFVIFDTETTGLDVYNDDIYQLAAIKIKNGRIVAGGSFEVFITTDREIPKELGPGKPNETRETYINCPNKRSPREALQMFVDYVGNCTLVGHNVDYDRRILQQNMVRCGLGDKFANFTEYYDTLKVANLLDPNLHSHKLEFLLQLYGLEGNNSHNALDDVEATFYLMEHQVKLIDSEFSYNQKAFITNPHITEIKRKLLRNYKPLFDHTFQLMTAARKADDECCFASELGYVADLLISKKYIKPIERFDYIVELIDKVVIDKDKDVYFNQQVNNHLFEIRTFNEADLFQNGVVKENVHIMTIHKAKGLQFDNVIVYDLSAGSFPHYRSQNLEEDARTLYVALSRAKKRLVTTYVRNQSYFLNHIFEKFKKLAGGVVKRLLEMEDNFVRAEDLED